MNSLTQLATTFWREEVAVCEIPCRAVVAIRTTRIWFSVAHSYTQWPKFLKVRNWIAAIAYHLNMSGVNGIHRKYELRMRLAWKYIFKLSRLWRQTSSCENRTFQSTENFILSLHCWFWKKTVHVIWKWGNIYYFEYRIATEMLEWL